MKILFVEDHWALRYSIANEGRADGYDIFEASSAEQALTLLQQFDFDVLVADIGLPGMSGDVLSAEARRTHPHLRLVFATGLDRIRTPASNDVGGPVVVRKPYKWKSLAAAIATAA